MRSHRLALRVEHARDRFGKTRPLLDPRLQGAPSISGQAVVLGAAILLADPPLGFDQTFALEPIQRRVKRAFLDTDRVTAELLDPGTLRLDDDGVLTCRVKSNRAKARFTRDAQFALGERLHEESGVPVLRVGDRDYPIPLSPDQAGALRQGRILTGIAAQPGLHLATDNDVPVALVELSGDELRVVRGFNL